MARFAVSRFIGTGIATENLPVATITANVLACIVLALVMLRYDHQLLEKPLASALLAVGFCGGFSTFSTFSYENFLLLKSGNTFYAILNILISVGACLAIFYLLAKRT